MPDHLEPLFLEFQQAVAGRYSLERELGRGGMGIVYLARDIRLDRLVAIKVLPPQFAAQPDLRERFLREARTSAKLSHPHIVPIYAVDEVDNFVFFVMALVEGETLSHRVRERGPLNATEAARILREVAWALAYAHAQGVVHRDVKPDNIMIESGSGRALVTDFGIARLAQAPGITGKGEVVGTPEFMSPEQACGEEVDGRSDLYSLGVVGYFALSGRLPFAGPTVAALLGAHLTQPPPPLPAHGVPRRLVQAIERCLAKEAAQRFAKGEDLAEAIALSQETRKEIPIPLRVFLRNTQNVERGLGVYVFLSLIFLPSFVEALLEGEVAAIMGFGAILGLLTLTPAFMYFRSARKLLRQGYGAPDVVLALEAEVERSREEVAFDTGLEASRLERWLSRLTYTSFGVAVASVLVAISRVGPWWEGVLAGSMIGGLVFGVPAALLAQRRLVPGARRLKFWKSRFGRFLLRLAGVGLKPSVAAHGTHRPTELAIGLAADALFDGLPKEVRRRLDGLPEAVKRLQDDAHRMRRRVEELNGMMTDAEAGRGGRQNEDRREALVRDLRAARDKAQERMGEAVAALETIRLDLLRLHGGVGTVETITADLAAAREVGEEVERLLEGRREVEGLLQQ